MHWNVAMRQTFRLLPRTLDSRLATVLAADGKTPDEVLNMLAYSQQRAASPGARPDGRRYRAVKEMCELTGLAYQGEDGLVHITDLGRATARWLSDLTRKNSVVLSRHAAFALASAQLQNPTRGGRYSPSVDVFPFRCIWTAILRLGNRISSEEVSREIFRIRAQADLEPTIARLAEARLMGSTAKLGQPVVTDNDRVIPWMSLASFGWLLILDKRDSPHNGFYSIPTRLLPVIESALASPVRFRPFDTTPKYVSFISDQAILPPDLR